MSGPALSIAGLDPSGGAGILADVETFHGLGLRPAAVVTAVTAQSRSRVAAVHPLPAARVREQLETLLEDGPPAAVKVGMLGSRAVVREVARFLAGLEGVPIVVDPVLRASAGAALLPESAIGDLMKRLLPLATVVTPNRAEAEVLLGTRIRGERGMIRATRALVEAGCRAAVVTGGDLKGDPVDVLFDGRSVAVMCVRRVRAAPARGTGCRYASAVAAYLAKGSTLRAAVREAQRHTRKYIRGT